MREDVLWEVLFLALPNFQQVFPVQSWLNLRKKRVAFRVPPSFGHNARASNFEYFLHRLNIPTDDLAATQDDIPVLGMEVKKKSWVYVQHA